MWSVGPETVDINGMDGRSSREYATLGNRNLSQDVLLRGP
jgi:hypothetical protein